MDSKKIAELKKKLHVIKSDGGKTKELLLELVESDDFKEFEEELGLFKNDCYKKLKEKLLRNDSNNKNDEFEEGIKKTLLNMSVIKRKHGSFNSIDLEVGGNKNFINKKDEKKADEIIVKLSETVIDHITNNEQLINKLVYSDDEEMLILKVEVISNKNMICREHVRFKKSFGKNIEGEFKFKLLNELSELEKLFMFFVTDYIHENIN